MMQYAPELIQGKYYFAGPDSIPFDKVEDSTLIVQVYFENGKIREEHEANVVLSEGNKRIAFHGGINETDFDDDSLFSYTLKQDAYKTPSGISSNFVGGKDIKVINKRGLTPEFKALYTSYLEKNLAIDPVNKVVLDYLNSLEL